MQRRHSGPKPAEALRAAQRIHTHNLDLNKDKCFVRFRGNRGETPADGIKEKIGFRCAPFDGLAGPTTEADVEYILTEVEAVSYELHLPRDQNPAL
jgi:hypothetical protein